MGAYDIRPRTAVANIAGNVDDTLSVTSCYNFGLAAVSMVNIDATQVNLATPSARPQGR